MKALPRRIPQFKDRQAVLAHYRNWKMARSAHAYVRGNALKFYEWLATAPGRTVPRGPAVWICGDCHIGNLGPLASAKGHVDVQIRDLDQTVIGNPAHDLIRLGLSLATAARGSDLPGVITAKMLEQMIGGYEKALESGLDEKHERDRMPKVVHRVLRLAVRRTWPQLATERIEDTRPMIPLGRHFWPLSKDEKRELGRLFATDAARRLATSLRSRDNDAHVELVDAAYWVKGCSSLGRLRFAALVEVARGRNNSDLCLIDVKEAVQASAPRYPRVKMPRDNAERVVEGARHLAPSLGDRMIASRFLDRSVFIRELRPQDLKLEIDQLSQDEAMAAARFLASVVGKAHARQMDSEDRAKWLSELARNRSKSLDAPSWLWTSVVELVVTHEAAYLEHCRRYATDQAAA